jgi:four helix bundle protein
MAATAMRDPLETVAAYRLALELAAGAFHDAGRLRRAVLTREIAAQLLTAAGSVGANIAEGYSRGTVADRKKFYEYALGSARECQVWYESCGAPIPESHLARLTSIRRLLLTMIRNARDDIDAEKHPSRR